MRMDAIRDEMAGLAKGSPLEMVGEYICRRGEMEEEAPANVTVKGAYKAMEDWAKSHKVGNSCFVPPVQAAKLIDRYMGWPELEESEYARILWEISMGEQAGDGAPLVERPKVSKGRPESPLVAEGGTDDLDLDALLGGM